MKVTTIEKCWGDVQGFWPDGFAPPTDEEKRAFAIRESTGKGEVSEGFKFAKAWKNWHITEWSDDVAYGRHGILLSEVPARYQPEVRSAALRKRQRAS